MDVLQIRLYLVIKHHEKAYLLYEAIYQRESLTQIVKVFYSSMIFP